MKMNLTTMASTTTSNLVSCTTLIVFFSLIAVAITDGPGALKQPVLRYLRTLCIAIDAATFYTSYAKRLAKRDLQLQAYLVSSKPSIVPITSATVREFAGKFMKHFSPSLEQVKGVAPAFEKLARSVDKASFNAVEHVEAILMAVACDSAGTDVGPSPDLELNSTATTTTTTPATTAIRSIFEVCIEFDPSRPLTLD